MFHDQNMALAALKQPMADNSFYKMVLGMLAGVQGLAVASVMEQNIIALDL